MLIYFVQILFLFCIILGILTAIYAFFGSRKIFWGEEKSKVKMLFNIALGGFSISLFSLSIVLLLGLADKNHNWTIQNIFASILVSLIPGFFVMLGTAWRFFIVGKYRDYLIKKLTRDKPK